MRPIYDRNGRVVPGLSPLNGAGHVKHQQERRRFYLTFSVYPEKTVRRP